MSVYITGMKMPKSCIECPMQFGGMCFVQPPEIDQPRVFPTVDECNGRTDWCPLVEVPKHGGLIDANRLIEIGLHLIHTAKNDDISNGVKWLWQYIIEAPVVIESEDGDQ